MTWRLGRVGQRGEACYSLAQIRLVGDRIAPEDGRRLVPGELHGPGLRDAGTEQVPRGRAPEVVPDPPD